MNITEEQVLENGQNETEEKVSKIDFKMVTFSLNNRDYAIDIMKIKEIAKANNFTIIPNAANYILGVYNLRGEIIPIIDLRKMFGLHIEQSDSDKLENVIILRLENHMIGLIVDRINKVIGIDSSIIQPPHPIFDDINIRYINGIVEYDEKMYILLDVERMLGEEEDISLSDEEKQEDIVSDNTKVLKDGKKSIEINFIVETLKTFSHFVVSEINRNWLEQRYNSWKKIRKDLGINPQLTTLEDAQEFLQTFYSPNTGNFWDMKYSDKIAKLIPDFKSNIITVWNPGCGKGFETYSFACLLKEKFNKANIKIWANDNDLLNISLAPSIVLKKSEILKKYMDMNFLTESNNGYQFSNIIKDSIIFEYHDVLHRNQYPPVDIILCRDLISFLSIENQNKILNEFKEKLKDDGILLIGKNENIEMSGFIKISEEDVLAFRKKNS